MPEALLMDLISRSDRLAGPLEAFYERHGVRLPPLEQVHGEDVPEPYRTLLVHGRDMTSTLERFHGEAVTVNVLNRDQGGEVYSREVYLALENSGKPVEFGAIRIDLSLFAPEARARILQEEYPLGRILKELEVDYASSPKAFLKIASDRLINEVLRLDGAHVLYGRRNTLLDGQGRCLADIVEILPPEPRR